MAKLGISVYPEHCNKEETFSYIEKAGKLGFKRIFTCLISIQNKNKQELVNEFKEICDLAHKFDMEVICDINPQVFNSIGLTYDNLELFKQMSIDGIRIDECFDGKKESIMTYNNYDLKIELNASMGSKYLDQVMSYYPNKENLITCHNFYPQKYTGLSFEHFNACNEQMKAYSLRTAAFVSSNNEHSFGPWPVYEGLPTLEMHRGLPISIQVRHLFATRMIDDVIIGNAFALDEELIEFAKIDPRVLTFDIELEKELTDVERNILYFGDMHIIRGDFNEYFARSSQPRIVFKDSNIEVANTRNLKRGDVVILNNNYPKYKGELQIVLKDIENDGRRNVIGHIPNLEHMLIDYIKPWRPIKFLGGK